MSDIQIPNPLSSGKSPLRLTVIFIVNAIDIGESSNNTSRATYSLPSTSINSQDLEPTTSSSDTYARILLVKSIGYPLWFPEPSNYPPEYQKTGIGIGDVGHITFDGHFDFLFNICLPSDHPVNYQAPPEFRPLEINREVDLKATLQICTGGIIASESIEPFESDVELQHHR
jgi:hypothetical protein